MIEYIEPNLFDETNDHDNNFWDSFLAAGVFGNCGNNFSNFFGYEYTRVLHTQMRDLFRV